MTTQKLQADVKSGVMNHQVFVLVNGIMIHDNTPTNNRLLNNPAFLPFEAHWLVEQSDGRWECDDFEHDGTYEISPGDFWKIFVR